MDHDLLASHVDAIHAVAREDFTGERDRRAKQLRADGHTDEATAIRAYRKPTVPAWAVNQLANRHADEVGELIAAGDQLRDAQRRATTGRGGAGLREATQRVRRLVAGLRDHAREVLEAAGTRSEAHLDAVGQTLFAAAVEPDHHESLRRGLFTAPLAGAGFGGVEGLMLVPTGSDLDAPAGARPGTRTATPDVGADGGGSDTAAMEKEQQRQADAERLRAAELQRAARRRELEQRRNQLQRTRERQQRRSDRAEAAAAQLRARLAEASADADEQRAALERIDAQLQDVQDLLGDLEQ